ncbi:MAG: CoA-binding protein [Candidatus Parcubacteria bacterium]|nr:CoA-binding protein [Candidatus Parcubacteria bacterium]
MEEAQIKDFINKDFIYAIVGATANKKKYGYRVLVDLKNKGFKVVPVNPKYEEVAGLLCVPDLISMEERPDVVVLIVGRENAQKIVKECLDLKLNRLWFQPGSEFRDAINMAQSAGFKIMEGKCIMVETENLI